ncbi:response regulator transcription factor [Cryomorphaceae bacterium 1068]|nr:response regulator transcription factor [Cryomorphaceae bacterium 1068]
MKARILLVEDEENFGLVLKNYLELSDYTVDLAPDGDVGFAKFKSNSYDLGILDVMMPLRDGFTLAKDIRKINTELPLIFLTARSEKEDHIKGYQVGGDDYLTKPFDSEVLLLKIEAILGRRNYNAKSEERIWLGEFEYLPSKRELKYHSDTTKLSPKENELLNLLNSYSNRVMPRSEALNKIWGNEDYFTTRSMDVYIAKLRKKLSKDQKISIENIHGSGYILTIS